MSHEPIVTECSWCFGDGTESVICEDCGEPLYEDTVSEFYDVCEDCAKQRDEYAETTGDT